MKTPIGSSHSVKKAKQNKTGVPPFCLFKGFHSIAFLLPHLRFINVVVPSTPSLWKFCILPFLFSCIHHFFRLCLCYLFKPPSLALSRCCVFGFVSGYSVVYLVVCRSHFFCGQLSSHTPPW